MWRRKTTLLAALLLLLPLTQHQAEAESSRKRLRKLRGKPMPKAAMDPRGTAAKILKDDPRFAKLVSSQNAAWKKGLSKAVDNWGKALRRRPVRLLRPRPKIPEVKIPRPGWKMPTWKWPSISLPSASLPSFPRIPWVRSWGGVSAPSWMPSPSLPSWISWPSWLSIPSIPWVRSFFRMPHFQAVGTTDWFLSWLHGVAMVVLAGFGLYIGALLLLLVLMQLGQIRVAGYWFAGLLRLLPGRLRTAIERMVGLVAPRELAATPKKAAVETDAAPPQSQERVELEQRTPRKWKSYAHELMSKGMGREAFRALYLAMMARLDTEGLIRFDHTLTNWDYRMMLPRGEIRTAFGELCRLFDQTVYGEYPCNQMIFDRGDKLVDQILALTAVSAVPAGPAPTTPPAAP